MVLTMRHAADAVAGVVTSLLRLLGRRLAMPVCMIGRMGGLGVLSRNLRCLTRASVRGMVGSACVG